MVLVGLEEMLQTEQLARPELLEIQVDQAIPEIMGLQELAVLEAAIIEEGCELPRVHS